MWRTKPTNERMDEQTIGRTERRKLYTTRHKCQGYKTMRVMMINRFTVLEPRHDKTNKVTVRPEKTQISLGIRPVWSESSLCAKWVAKDPSFFHADSEDSDQTGQMPRLIRPVWSESSLGAHSFYWFCHVTTQWQSFNIIHTLTITSIVVDVHIVVETSTGVASSSTDTDSIAWTIITSFTNICNKTNKIAIHWPSWWYIIGMWSLIYTLFLWCFIPASQLSCSTTKSTKWHAPSEDSDQPGHSPSLSLGNRPVWSVFTVRSIGS